MITNGFLCLPLMKLLWCHILGTGSADTVRCQWEESNWAANCQRVETVLWLRSRSLLTIVDAVSPRE